jgi:hypothetical protein
MKWWNTYRRDILMKNWIEKLCVLQIQRNYQISFGETQPVLISYLGQICGLPINGKNQGSPSFSNWKKGCQSDSLAFILASLQSLFFMGAALAIYMSEHGPSYSNCCRFAILLSMNSLGCFCSKGLVLHSLCSVSSFFQKAVWLTFSLCLMSLM